jgi:hypothetical protein
MQNGIIEKTVKIPFLALKINQLLRLIYKDASINSEFWMQYKAHGTQKPR